MAQRWSNLLFAHWPVRPEVVRALVPAALPLDLADGTAWVSLAAFLLSGMRLRGVPAVPRLSEFPELNVRTYVSISGKPGVYFFSLDAASTLAVRGARIFYHLPYHRAEMQIAESADGWISYRSHRTDRAAPPADFVAGYRPAGAVVHTARESLDAWLVERYCLYTVSRSGDVYRGDIHHRPWPLQPADATIDRNTVVQAAGIALPPGAAPRIAFARQQDVQVWAPERVTR
jgi:uncharacterized protein YqjF (DUF2071 family)